MFERLTERARQVVVLAQEETRALRHHYIGTEHILLGLLREEEGIAAFDPDGERWTIYYRGLNGSLRTAIRIGVTARHGRQKVTMTLLR